MSRDLSPTFRQAMFDENPDETVIEYLTLDRATWQAPVRLVAHVDPKTRDGETFVPYPLATKLPDDVDDGRAPVLELLADNVSRELTAHLRTDKSIITAKSERALLSSFDQPEVTFEGEIREAIIGQRDIRAEIRVEPVLDETFSRLRMDAENAPGLHRGGRGLKV
ncbi:hypothetical protein [Roseivivax sp. THAF197b]|uniref:hypothetical protein n=1 Tax=Roseivivax sp. THAF197b TaxID=2588299 RepID=UPI001267E727|nr:hypothetical protein [Roseivivax sp. THAF197b]QFS83978.1 hypothetical protein FIV09_14170 [Roseivivax sp. THAF197b]